jgi:hypothetical protein
MNLLNKDLASINEWSKNNFIAVNPSKSQAIIIGNSKLLKNLNIDTIPKPTLNGYHIPLNDSVKNIGLSINANLQWSQQVTNICKKVYMSLQNLRRLGYFLPPSLKAQLVKSLIMPHFDYGDIIYQDLSGELTLKLQRAQNAAVRFIFNLRKYDHISESYNKLGWLKLDYRRKLHILSSFYNISRTHTPEYIANEFVSLDSVHNRNTRGCKKLLIPLHRTETLHNSYVITASKLWNSLPDNIKLSVSSHSFKRKCHTYFQLDGPLN